MLMRQPCPTLQFAYQAPFGATLQDTGVQFSVFSRSATAMRLLLYNKVKDREPAEIIEFDRDTDRWGDVWSLNVPGIDQGQLYHFQASGPWEPESWTSIRFKGSTDRSLRAGTSLVNFRRAKTASCVRPSASSLMTILIGTAIDTSAATSANR